MTRSPRRLRGAPGQATVELALTLPVVAGLLVVLVQVGLVVRDQVLVVHAAREAARAAAVTADPSAARQAAIASGGLDPAHLAVRTVGRAGPGSDVTAEVSYDALIRFPLLAAAVPQVRLTASTTMRVEG